MRADAHVTRISGNMNAAQTPAERLLLDVGMAQDSRGQHGAVLREHVPTIGVVVSVLVGVGHGDGEAAHARRIAAHVHGQDVGLCRVPARASRHAARTHAGHTVAFPSALPEIISRSHVLQAPLSSYARRAEALRRADSPRRLRTRMNSALRWLAVLPAAGLASMGVEVAAGLYYTVFNPAEPLFWIDLVKSCLGSWAFVYVGYSVAPKAKVPTALVLAVLMTLLGVGGFWAWFRLRDSFLLTLAVAGPQAVVPCLTYFSLRSK